MQPQRASDAVRQPFTECLLCARHGLGTGGEVRGADGLEEGQELSARDRVFLVPRPICLPVEAHGHHCLLSKRMS